MTGAPPGAGRVAWFHCFAGVAGDMALGSLLDAGADFDEVVGMVRRLHVEGWSLEVEPVLRGGVGATRAVVKATPGVIVRTHAHIVGLIEEARLPDRVRERVLATFAGLAEAEGRIHRKPPAQVHFHEVGGVDAIVDVVGTCAALEVLGIDTVAASAVATGTGVVRTAHGLLPNPAPAVVELLRGAPVYGRDVGVELTTPTGAALLAALVTRWGALPAMTIECTGFGAGSRDIDDLPNATQVVVGAAATSDRMGRPGTGQSAMLLETNVDDATGETLAHAVAAVLEAGAHDAWVAPVLMKKGRPGHVVSALADPVLAEDVAAVLAAETGTLGVRGRLVERWTASRDSAVVEVDGERVRVKVSPGRAKAEYGDAARAARRIGLPLREVTRRAEEAWHATQVWRPEPGDDAS